MGIILSLNSTLVSIGNNINVVHKANIDENRAMLIVSIIGCFNSGKIEKSTGYIRPRRFCILLNPSEKVFVSYWLYAIKIIKTIKDNEANFVIDFLIIKFFKFIFSHLLRIFIK